MMFIVSVRPMSVRYWLNIIISQPIRMKATLSRTKRSKVNLGNVYCIGYFVRSMFVVMGGLHIRLMDR